MNQRILVVEQEDAIRSAIVEALAEHHEVVWVRTAEEAVDLLRHQGCAIVVAGLHVGRMTGLDLMQEIRQHDADALVVSMTDDASPETADAILRAGAFDCLVQPLRNPERIAAVAGRAARHAGLLRENRSLLEHLKRSRGEMDRMNAQLQDMANRDALTGLYNHRFFNCALEQELSRSKRHKRTFALLFADIDYFQYYNEHRGRLAGDDLLRTLAKLFQQRCRASTIAARYSGEQFVLLTPENDGRGAHQFAESLRQMVEAHAFPGAEDQPLKAVTLSLGVANYPEAGEDCAALIDRAERALSQSKAQGRNLVTVWEPSVSVV